MEDSKVNCFRRNLARNERMVQKSVAYRCVQRKARIAKMCTLCKFIVPVFGRFRLKCATEFQWSLASLSIQACRCDSHLLYRLVGVNVRILRVNLTLLCWLGVSNVLF